MRVIFADKEQRDLYFGTLKRQSGLSWPVLCKALDVKDRMLRFWRSGKLSTPEELSKKIKQIYNVSLPKDVQFVPLYRHLKEAGKKGALIRYKLYGNFGTPEGRRRGGLNSLKSIKLKQTNFKFKKTILVPRRSENLAEAIGIMIGDGGITRFQVKVTLGLKTDKDYAYYIQSIFKQLFRVEPSLFELRDKSIIEVVISSRALVELLNKLGLPIGNKIRQRIDIPVWIKNSSKLSKACIRGIFDTDGCVYLDKHNVKGRKYKSINIAIVSASPYLLASIKDILVREGLSPTHTSRRSVRLRRSKEVIEFFKKVGSSNPKHKKRFQDFLTKEEYRSGYNGTASKAVVLERVP